MSNREVVEFEGDGVPFALRFTYDAIDGIEREFGAEWMGRLSDLFNGRTVTDLVFVASLASGKPEKYIRAASPPVVPFVNALFKAWELAWHGQETPRLNVDGEADGSGEKKPLNYVRELMKRARPGLA